MNNTVEAAVFAVLWTTAAAFAVTGTMLDDIRLMFWAVMVSLVSLAGTTHIIVRHVVSTERLDIERLVDGMIARARERVDTEPPRLIKR